MTAALVIAGLGSFVIAVVCTWLVARNAARIGLLDEPNPRSSHVSSTPRGGGIGVVAGVAAGLLILIALGVHPGQRVAALLLATAAIAVLGAIDDVHHLRAAYRLVSQLVIAIALVIALGGVGRLPLPPPLDVPIGWLALPLTVLWLVGVTNFYNFMDGIDGLAGGQAVASCIGVAVAGWSHGAMQVALVLAASSLGFLVLNRPPAKIFLGDTGSTALGFAIAGLPLLAPEPHQPMALLAVAIGLSLFLLDPIETLLRLARARHRIGTAHRSHSYQLLASTRPLHVMVAGVLVAAGLALALAGALAYRISWVAWPAILVGLGTFGVERYLAGRVSLGSASPPSRLDP